MIPGNVMADLATQLGTIPGLRAYGWPTGAIQPPAAVVSYPTAITFDDSFQGGLETMTLEVYVVVGVPTERQTRDLVSIYAAKSGVNSVKAVLESATAPYTAMSLVYVPSAVFETVTVGATEYVSVKFEVIAKGSGS